MKSLIDRFWEKVYLFIMRGKKDEIESLLGQARFDEKTKAELNQHINSLETHMKNIEKLLGKKK